MKSFVTSKFSAAIFVVVLAGISFAPSLARGFSFTFTNVPPIGNPAIFTQLFQVGITGSDVGNSFDVDWFLDADDSGASEDLVASAIFTVDSLSSSQLQLTIDITNDTDGSFQAAILSFGFSTIPNATATFADTGDIFDDVEAGNGPNQTYPGGFKFIDICVFAANGCSGGAINDGLQSGGNSDSLTLIIAGNFGSTPSVTLDTFPIKFQTANGSFEFPGTPHNGGPPTEIPEPSSLILLGSGLAGLGFLARRKKTK